MASLDDIAIRKSERGFIPGGTGSGKSTLSEFLTAKFLTLYPNARCLVLDSKPRYRAEWDINGVGAKWRYRNWDHGAPVQGSYRADLTIPGYGLKDAWKLGGRIVIAQTEDRREWPLLLDAANEFFNQSRASRPQLLVVDELADFYGPNGQPIRGGGSDPILRAVRAGRERGMAILTGIQRPKAIPIQIKSELTKIYLFRLEDADDVKGLQGSGLPSEIEPPEQDHVFYYYNKPKRSGQLMQLALPKNRR